MDLLKNLNLENLIDTYVIPWCINIALALVVFVIGRIVASIIVSLVEKLLDKAKMEKILINFISSIVSAALTLFVIVAALDQPRGELGGYFDFFTITALQCPAYKRFRLTGLPHIAGMIGICCVDIIHPGIDRLVQHRDRQVIVDPGRIVVDHRQPHAAKA